jgi:hypothetical protein
MSGEMLKDLSLLILNLKTETFYTINILCFPYFI